MERITTLAKRFSLRDLGHLNFFVGIEIISDGTSLVMCQGKYIQEILHNTNMLGAKAVATPMTTSMSLNLFDSTFLVNKEEFKKTIGSLQYLLIIRPDVAFAVNKLPQHMHKPTEMHMYALKRALRYLKGTTDREIQIAKTRDMRLCACMDSDWEREIGDRTSTSAYIIYLGKIQISLSSKK